jgi:hypothetical protein
MRIETGQVAAVTGGTSGIGPGSEVVVRQRMDGLLADLV